ncbi:MAG TPA: hypothetical protein VLA68_06230, partial [Nitrososphaera sp.]|nr:hypothetical protein [Nitrososphaera sp.]
WAARSGKHSPDNICEATAYFGALGFSGNSWFQKKMFHGEGYTDRRASPIQVYDLQNRWVGVKLVAYNINADSSVKLELWLDDRPDNHWVKIAETIDSGNWNTDSPSNCGKTRDYVISEPRPRVLFRVDNASFEFKNLSVREIDPAGQS